MLQKNIVLAFISYNKMIFVEFILPSTIFFEELAKIGSPLKGGQMSMRSDGSVDNLLLDKSR